MATIRAFTTIEQSRKLAEILPIESADMAYYFWKKNGNIANPRPFILDGTEVRVNGVFTYLNCWSFAALLDVLPRKVELEDTAYTIGVSLDSINYSNVNNGNLLLEVKVKDNLVDACYEVIIKLYELKML